jgi:hypothetical protein
MGMTLRKKPIKARMVMETNPHHEPWIGIDYQ